MLLDVTPNNPVLRHDESRRQRNSLRLFSRFRAFQTELRCANRGHFVKMLRSDVNVAQKVGSDRFSSCALPRLIRLTQPVTQATTSATSPRL